MRRPHLAVGVSPWKRGSSNVEPRRRRLQRGGQPTGAFQRLVQDGPEVGTFADGQVYRAQPGDACAQCLDLRPPFVVAVQRFTLLLRAGR